MAGSRGRGAGALNAAAVAAGRRAWPVLKAAGTVVSLAIVAVIAVRAFRDLPHRHVRWALLVPALALTGVWWVLLAGGWSVLAGGRWTFAEIARWCRTQALRYLPGGIWAPVSRVAVTQGTALDRVSTVVAENLIALCAAAAIGGAALAASGRPLWGLLVLSPVLPFAGERIVRSRTRVEPARVRLALLTYVAAFAAYAGAALLVQASLSHLANPLEIVGAAAVAWAAGLVVVFAPSGIGARELAYVALTGSALPHGDASAGAVILRLVTVVAELAALLVVAWPSLRMGRHTDAMDASSQVERRNSCGS
ncbi:MAG: glycosyltransferase 2 family protein [Solirubrobacteraceae bacterium]|nr:glycosyltransferase 2 family protein [Solirubrobacteraceae bacterium]